MDAPRPRRGGNGWPKVLIAALVVVLCATWAIVLAEIFLDWYVI